MSRTVHCRKHKQDLPGLARAPFPGTRGEDIFQNISQQAWDEWQAHQTMIINERHLNMMDPNDRKFIMDEMDKFFAGEDFAKAEGFVPPSKN